METVLLVEDNPDDIFLIRRAFARGLAGAEVVAVRDGEEAIGYLAGRAPYGDRRRWPMPTMVLLDLHLPRRSGFEVLEWLRAAPGLRRLPVVVLTSSQQPGDIDRAYDVGANSYVVKRADPLSTADLARTLEAYWVAVNERPRLRECG